MSLIDDRIDLLLSPEDQERVDAVSAQLADVQRLGVAFSGGVDSAVLLALAVRTLGADRVVALMGVSASLAARERELATSIATQLGVTLREVRTKELALAEYRKNGPDRCFHCKNELFTVIDRDIVGALGLDAVAYGENADDAKAVDRPGQRAAAEHAVLRPLATAGIDKAAVRRIATALELPVANKPAAPCLASRIAPYVEVSAEKLAQVEAVENAIFDLGFSDVRVRHHGEYARIELPVDEIHLAGQEALRRLITQAAADAGFAHVSLDLNGIQSGAFARNLLNSRNAD